MRRFLVGIALMCLVTACSAGQHDSPAAAPSKPVKGLVDVGGHSLYVECRGSGPSTVVFEAGLSGDHRTWNMILPVVSKDARICSYDRANIGRSQAAPKPRTAQDIVHDLHALLKAAGEQPPYLLVGFSFGGLTSQVYAATYPDEIAGLVLVDSNHPDEERQFEAHLTRSQIVKDHAFVNENGEGIDVFASFDQAREAGSLPPVPLVVVSAAGISEGWPPGWNPAVFDRLRAEQQADLATKVPDGIQIFAKLSSHDVPQEQPTVVIHAIEIVLSKLHAK